MKLDEDKLVKIGIERAQVIARREGIKAGKTVGHPSDRLAYELVGIKDGIAVVRLPAEQSLTGQAIEKTFPADGLFDPNVAQSQAIAAMEEEIARAYPGSVVCRLD